MASGTLYTYPDNFRAFKALIAAQYGGGNVRVSPNFVFGETNKSGDYLKKFPLGKVPAFESDDGTLLTESNAIAFFVANDDLRGKDAVERAQILQWLSFADNEILPSACAWTFPYMGILEYNKEEVEGAKKDISNSLKYLNNYLLTRTYLVGERVTLADVSVACTLLNLFQRVMDPNFRKGYKNVERWFRTIVNQPKAKTVLGEIKLCEKAEVISPKKPAGKAAEPKKKGGGDESEGKKKDKKKEEKKEKEPEPEADDLMPAEPKSKNPFAAMPPGTWDMDDFKRSYSNEEVTVSIPYFWQKFDKEHYSVWLGEYKYNDELKKDFMSCNLISGMFQRLDSMRKAAFASVCLFGKDSNSSISGVWVWRGQDLAFPLSPDWQVDYESYEWTKLDVNDEKNKKLINDYLAWTGKDKNNREFNQGKIFK